MKLYRLHDPALDVSMVVAAGSPAAARKAAKAQDAEGDWQNAGITRCKALTVASFKHPRVILGPVQPLVYGEDESEAPEDRVSAQEALEALTFYALRWVNENGHRIRSFLERLS